MAKCVKVTGSSRLDPEDGHPQHLFGPHLSPFVHVGSGGGAEFGPVRCPVRLSKKDDVPILAGRIIPLKIRLACLDDPPNTRSQSINGKRLRYH